MEWTTNEKGKGQGNDQQETETELAGRETEKNEHWERTTGKENNLLSSTTKI